MRFALSLLSVRARTITQRSMATSSREELVLRGVEPIGERAKIVSALQKDRAVSVLWCPAVGQRVSFASSDYASC